MEKLTYTISEFCLIMGCSRDLARRLIREGYIKCLYLGRKPLIPKHFVDRMLREPDEFNLACKQVSLRKADNEVVR